MSDHPLSPITPDRADLAYSVLASAYRDNPLQRWLYPDDEAYAADFPALIAAIGDGAFGTGTAWSLDSPSAVALWTPPGVESDTERIANVLLETTPSDKHPEIFDTLAQTDAARPTYPHWYLTYLGVEKSQQGKGLGSRLLQACLDYIDLGGAAAYLVAPNARLVPFFERFGFVHTSDAENDTGLPLATMIRHGRPATSN